MKTVASDHELKVNYLDSTKLNTYLNDCKYEIHYKFNKIRAVNFRVANFISTQIILTTI